MNRTLLRITVDEVARDRLYGILTLLLLLAVGALAIAALGSEQRIQAPTKADCAVMLEEIQAVGAVDYSDYDRCLRLVREE